MTYKWGDKIEINIYIMTDSCTWLLEESKT
jgi:hypothetical protein